MRSEKTLQTDYAAIAAVQNPNIHRSNLLITTSLEQLGDEFALAQDVSGRSRESYRRSIRQFLGWMKNSNMTDPRREDVLRFKRDLEERGLRATTIHAYLVAVRRFFEWTESKRIYPNVAQGIKGAKRSNGFKKDPLTVAQVKELLASLERSSVQGKRDFAIINLLIRTGLRTIEVVRAIIGDIRQDSGEALLWIQGKGRESKDEFVLLTPDTLKPINAYLAARGPVSDDSPLFASISDRNRGGRMTTRSVSRIVKAALRDIGIDSDRLTAHSLRHTAITLTLQGGATIQEAQLLGRHSNINTTLVYAHNINRIAHAPERKIDALLSGN